MLAVRRPEGRSGLVIAKGFDPRSLVHLPPNDDLLRAQGMHSPPGGDRVAEGQQAVAEVALNRIASGDFPNNLHDVIYGQGQFRSVPRLDKAEPFQAQYEAIERAIYGPYILPKEVVYFATKPTNSNIWGQIGGHIFCYGNDYIAAAEK